jgi:peptidoglycan hydrolase CwlO-like protein
LTSQQKAYMRTVTNAVNGSLREPVALRRAFSDTGAGIPFLSTSMQRINLTTLRSVSLAAIAGFLLALLPVGVHADALSDLEAQVQRYQNELARINALQTSVLGQIADTKQRVGLLQGILSSLNAQLLENNGHLSDNQSRLDGLVAREGVLTDQLGATQKHLDERVAAFSAQIRVLDKVEARNPFGLLLTSHSFAQFLQRLTGIKQVSDGTHQMAIELRSDRDRLATQRAELDRERADQATIVATIEEQRQTLEKEYAIQNSATLELYALQAQLGQQQADLVGQAGAIEGKINGAEAQLASLLAFSHGQGGNIVPPEYLANSWGSYYNQRDARWGNVYLGRSPYEVWEIGCLLTSVAMVNSHFGFANVTPGAIAANPANFTAAGLLYNFVLNVPGHPATINSSPTRAWINQVLAAGGTVIVGMNIRSGGTHFVVLVGQNGPSDYWINDPWVENAMHVSYLGSPVTGPIYDAIAYT